MWRWLLVFLLLIIFLMPTPVLADSSDDITVTVTGWVGSAPGGLTLTYISDYEIGISWTKGDPAPPPPNTDSTVVNTMIRVKWGEAPVDRTDGYQVYYGDANSFSDTDIDLTSLTLVPWYGAWTETIHYDAGGNILSDTWVEAGTTEEANFMSLSWIFMALVLLAVTLTVVMFISRQAMLGFPCAIFWAILGGFSYTQSATTWDILYLTFFGSMGMAIFTMYAAYGLRTKKEEAQEGDELIDEGRDDLKFIDEGKEPETTGESSRRTKAVRDRAERRRSQGIRRKSNYGGF